MSAEAGLSLREAAGVVSDVLDPGGTAMSEKWVTAKIGPIPFAYPNTQGRKRLLAFHDLHHALLDYDTSLAGEAELAAWELGTGLENKTAIRYALRVFGFMLPLRWGRLFRAFVRGRHCRNLLDHGLDDATLERSVGEMRRELGLESPVPEPSEADRREWRVWAAKGIAVVWGPLLPLGLLLWWWLA